MRRTGRYARRTFFLVLVGGMLVAALGFVAGGIALGPPSPRETKPGAPAQREFLASVSEELHHVLLLEKLLEKSPRESEAGLFELSRRADAVGYLANLELARRYREAGQDPWVFYHRALSLHDSAPVRRELASWLEEAGRQAEAREHYLLLLPDEKALQALLRLEQDLPALAEELLKRELWTEAARVLEPLLEGPEGPRLERPYLRALVGMQRYGEALPRLERYWRENPADLEMGWWYARCLEVAGRREAAFVVYGRLGAKGSYRRGVILEQWGRLPEAAVAFSSAPEADGRWRGARLWEQLGRPDKALPLYVALGREPGRLQDDAAFRAYVLLSRKGDPLAEDFLTYLTTHPAWMDRLGKEPRWVEEAALGAAIPAFLKRAEAYRQSGRGELAQLELRIGVRLASLPEKLALGEWYLEEGHYFAGVGLGIEVLKEHPCARAYRVAYPRPFAEPVLKAAADYGLDPRLLWAVMREESHFRPGAVSRAGARGLMQIMPGTGEYIARQKGVAFEVDDLFDPETNIRFGAFYLASMLKSFRGDLDRALAAYNAGPGNAGRWSRSPLGQDPHGFPTAVTFAETREYITKVRNSYLAYLWLYGESDSRP